MDPASSVAAELWRPHHHHHLASAGRPHLDSSSVVTAAARSGGGSSGRRRPRRDASAPSEEEPSKLVSTSGTAASSSAAGGQDSVRQPPPSLPPAPHWLAVSRWWAWGAGFSLVGLRRRETVASAARRRRDLLRRAVGFTFTLVSAPWSRAFRCSASVLKSRPSVRPNQSQPKWLLCSDGTDLLPCCLVAGDSMMFGFPGKRHVWAHLLLVKTNWSYIAFKGVQILVGAMK